jgi:aspartyl-tRNA synthetase
MLLADTDNLREVIAFPKTGGGFDPLTAAPAPVGPQQLEELGLQMRPPKANPAAQG